MTSNIASNQNVCKSDFGFFKLKLGPLYVTCLFFVLGLAVISIFRTILTVIYYERLSTTPEFYLLFPVGIRMDSLLLSYLLVIPSIFLLILPKSLVFKLKYIFALWLTSTLVLIFYLEVATFPFIEEYDLRPDRKFFEYLQHPREVSQMLWKAYKLEVIVGSIFVFLSALFFWKISLRALSSYKPWRWNHRLYVSPLAIGLLFLGARSSIGHRPANLSSASFSNNHLANELALNSAYSLSYALYRNFRYEQDPSKMYGHIDQKEVFSRIKKSLIRDSKFEIIDSEIPFLHKQQSPIKTERPLNIVIFLQESMGAVDVGCLKGPDITPNLCRLKDEGLWFSNMYATGTRTVRGIEAVLSGFLPTANTGVVKLDLAKKGFFTAASLLKTHKYDTSFIYGGMSNFDEMKSFFLGNGFDQIYDEPTFVNPEFTGTWGVSDEDLIRKANQIFTQKKSKPFFSLILSTSNHVPYEFPDGEIKLYEQPKQTHSNAIKYADHAIGLFFELAKKEEYFKNTLFLVVADHNSHVRGNDHVPIDKFHIPALLIGPNVPQKEISLLSSQIDLMPTLMHFSGLDSIHPMVGRNLMQLAPEAKGRSIMQYADNAAYRVEDQVIVLRPFLKPKQFDYSTGKMVPAALDQELAQDALAYASLPWLLYSQKLYRLP